MDSKTIAWVSYITLVGWIIALVSHSNSIAKSSLAVFHLRQSFGLMVFYFGGWIILSMFVFAIPFLGTIIYAFFVALFILWIIGLISAINGEEKPLPIVGPLFQQWFTFIK